MEIQERYRLFLDLERVTGKHIAQKMLDFYEESRKNSKQCRNQGYDGAPNMQSEKGLLVLY